jgi:nitrogen-specific signal transduction histidine kinase
VEITIRDPFFTTKPTGEGTSLGLSISHDIIVKQHAGLIEVDTQPGEFIEVRIILPPGFCAPLTSGRWMLASIFEVGPAVARLSAYGP